MSESHITRLPEAGPEQLLKPPASANSWRPRHWQSFYERLIENLKQDLREIVEVKGSEGIHTRRYQKQSAKLKRAEAEAEFRRLRAQYAQRRRIR